MATAARRKLRTLKLLTTQDVKHLLNFSGLQHNSFPAVLLGCIIKLRVVGVLVNVNMIM